MDELRIAYCDFILKLGQHLKIPQVTIASATYMCHKYTIKHSMSADERFLVGAACLFLAAKMEETFRQARDVLYWTHFIRYNQNQEELKKLSNQEYYQQELDRLFSMEQKLMITTGFDFNVSHPYKPLIAAVKQLKREYKEFDDRSVAQVAWNFINDALRTPLCLKYKAEHMALAAVYLATKFLKIPTPPFTWFQKEDIAPALLQEISSELLQLYEKKLTREEDQAALCQQQQQQQQQPELIQLKQLEQQHEPPRVSPGEGVVDPPRKRKELDVDIDEAKLKAAREKRRKHRSQVPAETKKQAITDEELLERELEIGVEQEVAKEKAMSRSPPRKVARTGDVVPENADRNRGRERSPGRQESTDRNRGRERSPSRQESTDRNRVRERSPARQESTDRNRVRERSPARQELTDRNRDGEKSFDDNLERRDRSFDNRYHESRSREKSYDERSSERMRERNSFDERNRDRITGWERGSDGRPRERIYGKTASDKDVERSYERKRPLDEVPEEGELPPEPVSSPRYEHNHGYRDRGDRRQICYDNNFRSYTDEVYDNRRRELRRERDAYYEGRREMPYVERSLYREQVHWDPYDHPQRGVSREVWTCRKTGYRG